MRDVVRECASDAREHVLEAFTGEQIAVAQRCLAEAGEKVVAGPIELEVRGPRWLRERSRQWRTMRGRSGHHLHAVTRCATHRRHEGREVAAFIEIEGKIRHRSPR